MLFGALFLIPQSARGGEISILGGYGVLGTPSPVVRASLSFGKRVAFDINGGIVFASADNLQFSEFTKKVPLQEKIPSAKIPSGSLLYSVGAEIRVFVRGFGKKHNAYLGAGADWLPQLGIYYPGVKAVSGYQLKLLKKGRLVMRFGAEYYLYGVLPANELAVTTSIGFRF